MSTRRARIKAVISLPQRRKNAAKVESKCQEEPLNNDSEKEAKSPKLSHSNIAEGITSSSPVPKVQTPVRARKTPLIGSVEKVSEPLKVVTPVAEKRSTPKQIERVPVITSSSSLRSLIFSPPSKRSPLRKHVPSPVRNSKVVTENTEKTLSNTKETISKTSDLPKEKDKQIVNKNKFVEENVIEIGNVVEKTTNAPEDYQIPSVPESIIDDPMDGIVPLQPVTTQKPIAALKNEIISENAEVLFDPIVPLPSPSKVRPKLRPVPRLAPLRRNSVQGSASESEDESRRALLNMGAATPSTARQRHDSQTSIYNRELSRIRNDSICSSASQTTASQAPATSPIKEKNRSRRQEISRKMAAIRRRRETVKREGLTMYDLIFYNPLSNPFVPNKEETEAKETIEKEAAKETEEESADDEQQDATPVPQIKLGLDGKIILDEQSLVIKQSRQRVSRGVVREGAWSGGARPYRRTKRTAEWADAETVRFYRALAAIGTDFSLMEPLFPGRTRRDLKLKFKKEEKLNCAQVDKAIRSAVEWDAGRLLDEFAEERAEEARREQKKRELLLKEKNELQERKRAAKELGVKQSRSARTLGSSILPAVMNQDPTIATTADEIIARATENKKQRKRKQKEPTTDAPAQKVVAKIPIPQNTIQNTTPPLTTFTIKSGANSQSPKRPDMATQPNIVNLTDTQHSIPVPPNVEKGSLVVLTVNDPNSPSKKMLQTYIASGAGKLTPVALPSIFLNSVVGYMQRTTTPKSNSARSSPLLTPPPNVVHENKAPSTPGVIQINPSPSRQKLSSYSITPL